MSKKDRYSMNMTKGGTFAPIIAFAVPLMLTGILQVLYNAADMIVVGRFSGKNSLAAIGSTSSAINLIVNIFIGLSSAASVIVARKFGANNKTGVSKAVHTAIALSLCGGVILGIVGIFISYPLMRAMGSPSEVIGLSTLYMRIYFAGIPAIMLYNFASSILRAIGDTKRPLYFLTLSGIINIVLNLVFVIYFHLDVAGVAIATVISQLTSALLVLRCLVRSEECYRLVLKNIRFYKKELSEILYLGIPAGIQSSVFSLSNIMIQSSINSVGSIAMAGNAASGAVEGIAYTAMNSVHHATLTFVSQNYGALNFRRIMRGFIAGCITVTCVGLLFGGTICLFSEKFISLYSDIPEVISCGALRLRYMCSLYFLCGLMEIGVAGLRGIGASIAPMLISIVGVCGIRLFIVIVGGPYTEMEDLIKLYVSYHISWAITMSIHFAAFGMLLKRRKKNCISVAEA